MSKTKLTDYISLDELQGLQKLLCIKDEDMVAILDKDGNSLSNPEGNKTYVEEYVERLTDTTQGYIKNAIRKSLVDEQPSIFTVDDKSVIAVSTILVRGQFLAYMIFATSLQEGQKLEDAVNDDPMMDKLCENVNDATNLISTICYQNYLRNQQIEELTLVNHSQMNYINELSTNAEDAIKSILTSAKNAHENPEECAEAYVNIILSANELSGTVDDAVEYAKLIGGQFTNSDYDYNLEQMLNIVSGTAMRKLGDDVEIIYEYDDEDDVMLMGDAGCVSQIINRIINFCVSNIGANHVRFNAKVSNRGYAKELLIQVIANGRLSNFTINPRLSDEDNYRNYAAMQKMADDMGQLTMLGNLVKYMNGRIGLKVEDGNVIFTFTVLQLEVR